MLRNVGTMLTVIARGQTRQLAKYIHFGFCKVREEKTERRQQFTN